MSEIQNDLVTRNEAAGILGVKSQTLAVWASTGRYGLKWIKVGRLAKYRRSDLAAFLVANTVGAQPALAAGVGAAA